MDHEPAIRLTPPPAPVLRVLNPVMRALLLSPLAGRMPPAMVVLEFTGRRSGRRFIVPVGMHDVDGRRVVFTEARWRYNFTQARAVTVRRGRERHSAHAVLVEDPDAVAAALAVAMARVGARNLAMTPSRGRQVGHDDLVRLGRSMLVLELGT